jgi:hypothetical protein
MQTTKTISPGQWGFPSRIKVEDAILQCRQIRQKFRALRRLAEFLVHNFGDPDERHGAVLGVFPEWANTEAERLLDYDRTSPHAIGANVIALALTRARAHDHWPMAA